METGRPDETKNSPRQTEMSRPDTHTIMAGIAFTALLAFQSWPAALVALGAMALLALKDYLALSTRAIGVEKDVAELKKVVEGLKGDVAQVKNRGLR